MGRVSERLSFANAMSVIAVFIALGGTAIAATQLPKDSVGAKQIKKGAVRSPEVKDFSLRASDFAKGQLPAGRDGATGPAGPTGPTGAAGASASQVFALVRTGGCCGGAPPLDPPQLSNAHGVTGVEIAGTGQYEVTFDADLLPAGDVGGCVPLVSLVSADASHPMEGEVGVGRSNTIPSDKLTVYYRNSAGTLAALHSGGGSAGFSIALLC